MLTFPKSPDEQLVLKIVLPVAVCIVVVLFFGYKEWRRRNENCTKTSSSTLQTYDLHRPPPPQDSAEQSRTPRAMSADTVVDVAHLQQNSVHGCVIVLADPIPSSEDSVHVYSGNSVRLPMSP